MTPATDSDDRDRDRDLRLEAQYSSWPTLKHERASSHAATLWDLYSIYLESLGKTTTVEYDDAGYAIVRARITHLPPSNEWSLIFGDAIHNYRAALDALAWAVAHIDGRSPANTVQIQFPIATSRREWEQLGKKQWFAHLPPFIRERLHDVQPFQFPEPDTAIAVVLHRLDIKDKHHESLALSVLARSAHEMPIVYRSRDPEVILEVADTAEYPHTPGPIEDGDIVFRIKLDGRATVADAPRLPIRLTTTLDGEPLDVWHLLNTIDRQVALTLASVESGQASERFQTLRHEYGV